LPVATGAKLANPELTVIVESGDGCNYGEGGNHFLAAIRRNINLTLLVHNNQVYGLTKGQASPTTAKGVKTALQPEGVVLTPFNPLAVAISLDAPFVARSFSAEVDFTADLILKAMDSKGFALIDVLQPCVSFNKINTAKWYRERAYKLGPEHDPTDRAKALEKAFEWGEKIPLGIIYEKPRPGYAEQTVGLDSKPICGRITKAADVEELVNGLY
jgi:2-oxoglutarate ferredoxin oxidoreductase subunit beta